MPNVPRYLYDAADRYGPGSVTTLDIPLTLEANQPPQLTAPRWRMSISALYRRCKPLYFSSNFSDEIKSLPLHTRSIMTPRRSISPRKTEAGNRSAEVRTCRSDCHGTRRRGTHEHRLISLRPATIPAKWISIRIPYRINSRSAWVSRFRVRFAYGPHTFLRTDRLGRTGRHSPFAPASVDLSALSGGSYTLSDRIPGLQYSELSLKL